MMNNPEMLPNPVVVKNDPETLPNPVVVKNEMKKGTSTDPKEMKLTRKNLCEQWISDQSLLPAPEAVEIDLSDNPKLSCKEIMRQMRSKRISDQTFKMECEWDSCSLATTDYQAFGRHVKDHLSDVQLKTYETGENLYACKWKDCNFETQNDKEISRHVHFHSYHTKLKAIGVNVHRRYFLVECEKDTLQRNQIPELLSDFQCYWIGCTMTFANIQEFFDHTQCHVIGIDPGQDGRFSCSWLGCKQHFPSLNKVKTHFRRHTGEKVVACFNCGGMFATNVVFEDHCARQAEANEDVRCETCGKSFPSERILRSHVRRHINSFKCSYCGGTFPSPSGLSKHIRYKHLNYRPFHCQYCPFMAVDKLDLHSHVLRHEGLAVKKKKSETPKLYACHNCDKYFLNGHSLTKHLIRHHGYDQTSGSFRLRYEMSEDGYYRLIPVRYESLDISVQIEGQDEENRDLEKDTEEFQLMQCSEGDNENLASFVAVPSSVDDPESFKDALLAEKNKISKNTTKNADQKSNKNPKAKNSRKSTSKNTKSKRMKMDTSHIEPVTSNISIIKSNSDNEECSPPSPLDSVNGKPPNSIVISIAHIDEEGKVIKKEVIKSEEMVI